MQTLICCLDCSKMILEASKLTSMFNRSGYLTFTVCYGGIDIQINVYEQQVTEPHFFSYQPEAALIY